MPPQNRQKFTITMRRAAGAQALMLAKMSEFGAHVTADNRLAADRARTEAAAALDSFFDLSDMAIREDLAQGY